MNRFPYYDVLLFNLQPHLRYHLPTRTSTRAPAHAFTELHHELTLCTTKEFSLFGQTDTLSPIATVEN
jgi:hypothetical protein